MILETLEIDIQHKSVGATQAVDELVTSLENLRNILTQLKPLSKININSNVGGIFGGGSGGNSPIPSAQEMGEVAVEVGNLGGKLEDLSKDARGATPEIIKVNDKISNTGDSAKKSAGGVDKFFTSLKRIAFYRLLRTALKEIVQGLKDGADNAYQWSKAIGGDFAQNMDKISTLNLQFKNTLGATVVVMVNELMPVIEKLMNAGIQIFNSFNRLLARLSGAKSFIAAKKVTKEYADELKSANKELSNLTAGFDEFNILADNSTKNSDELSYKDMFEEIGIDESLTVWDDILEYALSIGAAIALWKVAGFVSDLGSILTKLGGIKSICGTLAAIGTIVIAIELFKDGWDKITNANGEDDLIGALELALSTALGGAAIGGLMFKEMFGVKALWGGLAVGLAVGSILLTLLGIESKGTWKGRLYQALGAALGGLAVSIFTIKNGFLSAKAGLGLGLGIALGLDAIQNYMNAETFTDNLFSILEAFIGTTIVGASLLGSLSAGLAISIPVALVLTLAKTGIFDYLKGNFISAMAEQGIYIGDYNATNSVDTPLAPNLPDVPSTPLDNSGKSSSSPQPSAPIPESEAITVVNNITLDGETVYKAVNNYSSRKGASIGTGGIIGWNTK